MRAILFHNPSAGHKADKDDILAAKLADFEVRYVSVKNGDIEKAFEKRTDLIVIAGGDGTITEVMTNLRRDEYTKGRAHDRKGPTTEQRPGVRQKRPAQKALEIGTLRYWTVRLVEEVQRLHERALSNRRLRHCFGQWHDRNCKGHYAART